MKSSLFLVLCTYVQTVNLQGILFIPACIVILNRYNDLGGFHCVFWDFILLTICIFCSVLILNSGQPWLVSVRKLVSSTVQ